MKILYISNPNSPHTRRWVNWFHQHGHIVRVIGDGFLKEAWPGMQIDDLPAKTGLIKPAYLKYLTWSILTRRIIREFSPQVLHAHRVTSAGWIGAYSGFHPFIVTPWGSDLMQFPRRSRLAAWLTRRVITQADLLTVNSQELHRLAVFYGAPPERIRFVQWGVDLDRLQPAINQVALRQRLNWHGVPILYCPRAMHPIYNLHIIVEAMPAIRQRYPQALLILHDYNPDPAYRLKIEQIIEKQALKCCVKIIPPLPWQEMAAYYQAADLMISVPSSDSTAVSLLEAMACGLPIIASDLPAMREWIHPGENGLLVPIGNPQALAQAVIDSWSRPDQLIRYRQVNLALVQERANHQVEMQRMEEFYRSLLPGYVNPALDGH